MLIEHGSHIGFMRKHSSANCENEENVLGPSNYLDKVTVTPWHCPRTPHCAGQVASVRDSQLAIWKKSPEVNLTCITDSV
jgi:hypothetical protein